MPNPRGLGAQRIFAFLNPLLNCTPPIVEKYNSVVINSLQINNKIYNFEYYVETL